MPVLKSKIATKIVLIKLPLDNPDKFRYFYDNVRK